MQKPDKALFDLPVLFITFARPDYARQTFDAIKRAKPQKLYFYSNKARTDHEDEVKRNEKVRSFIKEIDWECKLELFFRDEYVDMFTSIWGAIDWIFENEEQAMILEEDCVPSVAFFHFCDQLLTEYKHDQRIWLLSGNNIVSNYNQNNYDYIYSYFPYLYGWASWRDRWKKIFKDKLPYEEIVNYKLLNHIYFSKKYAKQALSRIKEIINTPAWDYRFQLAMKCNGGLGIIPKENLVTNIGLFGENSKGKANMLLHNPLSNKNIYNISKKPPFVVVDYDYNLFFLKHYYRKKNIFFRIIKRLKK